MSKATKAEAHYRDGSGRDRCARCTMYHPFSTPHGGYCDSVEGQIEPDALCDYFEPAPAFASLAPRQAA